MATINLTWDVSTIDPNDDIDNLEIWRIDNDVTSSYTQSNGQITASDAALFVAATGASAVVQNLTTSTTSYDELNVINSGNGVTYGVFSKNAVGYGPGSIAHISGF